VRSLPLFHSLPWFACTLPEKLVAGVAASSGRGYEQAAAILGADFEGFQVRDGWLVYRGFTRAMHPEIQDPTYNDIPAQSA
jgi:hypothetical protein